MDSVRADLRAFLADPAAFAAAVPDWQRQAWREGLRFAEGQLTARPLRPAQRAAWEGSTDVRAALVLGPPGTGKTYLLAWMVAGFVWAMRGQRRPCRVLFTGFTRESIGNLFDDFTPIARAHLAGVTTVFFGPPPEQPLPAEVDPVPLSDAVELKAARQVLNEPLLVAAATGWSLFKLFERGAVGGAGPTAAVFDLVVVDEASQLTLAQGLLGLSGLAAGGRVVVAGDDRQLPPVRAATDATAADGRALGGSLYAFLKSGEAPEFRLTETFRLNAPLADLPARLFYDGEYTSAVPNRRLGLRTDWADGLSDWLRAAVDPEHPVCVLVHDGPPCGTDNPFERQVICKLVAAFADRLPPEPGSPSLTPEYLWAERLAVVTPHRAQNAALRADLGNQPFGTAAVVETVDRIQGRERDVVVAGYVVSDPEFAAAEAEFLFGPERLNVTVTRPRSKLVLVLSRRLLEVMPADERTLDAAFALREYALDTDPLARIELPGPDGPVSVELRVRRFASPPPPPPAPEPTPMPPPVLTASQQKLLDVIREVAGESEWCTAAAWDVEPRLGWKPMHTDYRGLVEAGRLSAIGQVRKKDGSPFLVWRPRDEPLMPLACTTEVVRANLDHVLEAVRPADGPAWYDHKRGTHVRDQFLWFDWQGKDLLEPLVRQFAQANPDYRFSEDGKRFDRADQFVPVALPVVAEPPDEELSDDDFRLLNAVEEEEARRINFGAFETTLTPSWLASQSNRPTDEVRAALTRLARHHYLLWVGEAVRSRFAELAREVRYVRQRFGPDDADRRPHLVRAVQVRTVPRTKPTRDQQLSPIIDQLKAQLSAVGNAENVIDALHAMLKSEWGEPVSVAGFQLRALRQLLPAYLGVTRPDAFVVTADTGSGKTEAALLPLMAGAAIDRLAGRRGTKAVLVYPRVRLAYNQAERLVKYLALLAAQPGGPQLTAGVQSKDVPFSSHQPATYEPGGRLVPWEGDAAGGFEFPLFSCPNCGKRLRMKAGGGTDGHDRLECTACPWAFGGWAGSKQRVQKVPPDFFLPVAESLSQWLHDHFAGSLFGDRPEFAPPRALLADEIHLYSHIQGAQIGYVLRRLLARCEVNARPGDARPARPLAVGMSATLGEPGTVWGQLTGRSGVTEITPDPDRELRENPRAREHFYFVQPEVESRGHAITGAATTIQSLMCLAHGLRRRPGDRGGYRGLVFFDSIDTLKQLHHDYTSAERENRLAALRTRRFPTDPATRQPRPACCGTPADCDTFRNGECWFFAAAAPQTTPPRPNDPFQVAAGTDGDPVGYAPGRPLAVMDRPVYSGTGGRVEEEMGRSDLVFSTSSLEVGFDDPDMILVYQHYAPGNLASFAQRKGRGGRGSDDRPVTGCTLSIYSPKDNWYFRHPDQLLQGNGFDVPLNPDNFFVRRGQAVAALLDAVARRCAQTSKRMPEARRDNLSAVGDLVRQADDQLVRLALGNEVYRELRVDDLPALWQRVVANVDPQAGGQSNWRELLPWVPVRLFDAINLPLLRVTYPMSFGEPRTDALDVSLAFGLCAPGNATRRFDDSVVHWVQPPVDSAAPMFAPGPGVRVGDAELVEEADRLKIGNTAEDLDRHLRAELPDEVAARLHDGLLYHHLLRPEAVRLDELGRFVKDDGRPVWRPWYFWDAATRQLEVVDPQNNPASGLQPVHHKTGSRLLGFPLVAQISPGRKLPIRGLHRLALDLTGFTGGVQGNTDTGLRVHRTYWGCDVTLKLGDRGETEECWTVTFTDGQAEQPALYGYRIDTEGVRLRPNADRLTEFVTAEVTRIAADPARDRWHRGQFFRYQLAAGLAAEGMSHAAAGPVAELLIAANAEPELRPRLLKLRTGFDPQSFLSLLNDAQRLRLAYHPLLTASRVRELDAHINRDGFAAIFQRALGSLTDGPSFNGYVRSLVLHGLLLKLHALFVVHGRGEPRQVIAHAKLPIQFTGRATDDLTVFETGDHGDGTTRMFLKHLDQAFADWRRGELAACPYATEQALLEQFFERADRHRQWKQLDPRHPDTLPRVGRELTGTRAVSELHLQALGRLLYQSETVGARRFDRYELSREVRSVGDSLSQVPGQPARRPPAWEVVSEVVQRSVNGQSGPHLSGLLAAYRALTPDQQDSLRPEARLADQVYRLGVKVCADGCRACLHQASPLMAEELVPAGVSREVLHNYGEFLLEPSPIRVGTAALPDDAQVGEVVRRDGVCRLLVAPAVNDDLAGALRAKGFTGGEYDPLLRQVVWLKEDSAS